MEIALLSKDSLRIKGKQSSFIVDPKSSMPKTPADFVISLLRKQKMDSSKVEGYRVVIEGQGEYEVSGVKMSVYSFGDDLIYNLIVDGVDILLGSSEGIKKAKEKVKESHVVVVKTDSSVDESAIAAVTPSVVILYGEKSDEGAQVLGKQDIKPTSKYSTTLEKLPAEMEVVILQ